MTTNGNLKAVRAVDILLGLLIVICTSLAGFGLSEQYKSAQRLASIESNRFTSKDGLAVWQAISTIREDMARVPEEFPPKDFKDSLDRRMKTMQHGIEGNAVTLDKINAVLHEVQRDVDRHLAAHERQQ